jgi:glycosylphosphatidylinositol transamidase
MEAVKTYKTNPNFVIGTTQIPTWITPIVMVLFVSFLIPHTSFLGHVCGLAFGYGCKLFELKYQGIVANFNKGASDISNFLHRQSGY